jgi:hypothetical protein
VNINVFNYLIWIFIDSGNMRFKQPSYEGEYDRDHAVSHPVISLDGLTDHTEFSLQTGTVESTKLSVNNHRIHCRNEAIF